MRTEDGYIIQQCLDGDPMAFGLLVDKYKRSIYALAFSRVHNFHDAQDIAQEVFIKAYKNLHSLKRWDNFLGWLYRITCNQCNDWIRSGSKRPDHDYIEDQEPSNLDNISLDFYNADMTYSAIRESLESLPEVYREVLSLRYFGGMNVMEISKLLGISTRTIDRRLNEAISRLKEETLAMIGTAREQHELPSAFTFRVVEIIKHIRVNPISPMKALPLGLTLAIGIIGGFLSIGAHLNPTEFIGSFTSSISESKVLDVGEFPVNVLKVSKTPVISNQQMNGDGLGSVVPSLQNALFMAPQDEFGKWVRKADMPTARMQLSGAMVNGKIYAIGGVIRQGANFLQLSTVEEYDPTNDEWTEKASMPTKRFSENGAIVIDGLIYVFGGADGNTAISTVEAYDPSKDKWIKKADMPTERGGFFAGAVNGHIYFLGGYDKNLKSILTVEEYDPVKDIWIKKADMPAGKYAFGGMVFNNKIYTFGGETIFAENNGPAISLVEEYDPATDTWTRKADLPTPRILPSVVTVDNKIYTIGGFNGATVYPNVEIYDPSNDTWSKGKDLLVPTLSPITFEVNGKIYVIGGGDLFNDLSVVQEYDTGFKPSQSIESKGKLPTKLGQIKQDQ